MSAYSKLFIVKMPAIIADEKRFCCAPAVFLPVVRWINLEDMRWQSPLLFEPFQGEEAAPSFPELGEQRLGLASSQPFKGFAFFQQFTLGSIGGHLAIVKPSLAPFKVGNVPQYGRAFSILLKKHI